MSQPPSPPQYGAVGGEYPVGQQPGSAPYPPNPPYPPEYPTEPPPKYENTPKGAHGPPYPPQQPYQGAYPQGQATIIITNVSFGPHPVTLQCPHCHAMVTTTVMYGAGAMAWLLSGLLCLFGCWLCAILPCCMADCQDVEHDCPNCGVHLGTYTRL